MCSLYQPEEPPRLPVSENQYQWITAGSLQPNSDILISKAWMSSAQKFIQFAMFHNLKFFWGIIYAVPRQSWSFRDSAERIACELREEKGYGIFGIKHIYLIFRN